MALGDYVKTTYVNGSAPAISAVNLNNIETKVKELDTDSAAAPLSSNHGLLASYPPTGLPDIPDTASGITYKSNWLTGVDGWTGANATLAVSGGELVATVTANGMAAIIKDGFGGATNRTIRIMYKSNRAGTVNIYGNVGGVSGTLIATFAYSVANAWKPLDCFVVGALTIFYTQSVGMIAADVIRLQFAYVGTGEYDYPLIDGSGNANHAKVYRVLPIQDTLGQMLRFNGVNAYAQIPSTSELAKAFAKVGGIVGASFWVRPLNATPDTYIISSPDSSNSNRFYVAILNGTTLQFKVFNLTPALDIACATNELAHITVVRSGVDGKGYAWKNGVPLTPIQQPAAVASASYEVYIGKLVGSDYSNFDLFGLRFFDFLPTDAQAMNMFKNSVDSESVGVKKTAIASPYTLAMRNLEGYLDNCDPEPVATSGYIGYQVAVDVAASGTLTMPAGSGTYFWTVLTYGATINGLKSGSAVAGISAGNASANLTALVKRIY